MMPKNKTKLIYSDAAYENIDRLASFLIEKTEAQTAFDIIDDLIDGIDKLAEMPYLGSPHPDKHLADKGFMTLFIKRYVCVYIIQEKEIHIIGVFHQKTDWLSKFNPI
jgi:plasmid stabilization system protein ParE